MKKQPPKPEKKKRKGPSVTLVNLSTGRKLKGNKAMAVLSQALYGPPQIAKRPGRKRSST